MRNFFMTCTVIFMAMIQTVAFGSLAKAEASDKKAFELINGMWVSEDWVTHGLYPIRFKAILRFLPDEFYLNEDLVAKNPDYKCVNNCTDNKILVPDPPDGHLEFKIIKSDRLKCTKNCQFLEGHIFFKVPINQFDFFSKMVERIK